MTQTQSRWGQLFGARARDWAETWEGPNGWGDPAYRHVLDRAEIGPASAVLDCGCGAGRFAQLAADRGARVAGIHAAEQLVAIAAERTPGASFRVGDLQALPWAESSFDVVTGFSTFQFAEDKTRALSEARRVSRGLVAVVLPTRVGESGIAAVFKPLLPLSSPGSLEVMQRSGMFALSEPGRLDDVLASVGLTVRDDAEIDCAVAFPDTDNAARAFLAAGPIQSAISYSGEQIVERAVRVALTPFTGSDGSVTLPSWFRAAIAGVVS